MNVHNGLLMLIIFTLSTLISCDKGNEEKNVSACFNYTANGATVTFNSSCSEGAESYDWEFGDGLRSINSNPVHSYAVSGSYVVTLRVTGNGKSSTGDQTINVVGSVCKTCFCGSFGTTQSCGTEAEVNLFCAGCFAQGGPCTRCE